MNNKEPSFSYVGSGEIQTVLESRALGSSLSARDQLWQNDNIRENSLRLLSAPSARHAHHFNPIIVPVLQIGSEKLNNLLRIKEWHGGGEISSKSL